MRWQMIMLTVSTYNIIEGIYYKTMKYMKLRNKTIMTMVFDIEIRNYELILLRDLSYESGILFSAYLVHVYHFLIIDN